MAWKRSGVRFSLAPLRASPAGPRPAGLVARPTRGVPAAGGRGRRRRRVARGDRRTSSSPVAPRRPAGHVGPEPLELVERPGLVEEDVHDEVAVVEQHPGAGRRGPRPAGAAGRPPRRPWPRPPRRWCGPGGRSPGGDHEELDDREDVADVEHDGLLVGLGGRGCAPRRSPRACSAIDSHQLVSGCRPRDRRSRRSPDRGGDRHQRRRRLARIVAPSVIVTSIAVSAEAILTISPTPRAAWSRSTSGRRGVVAVLEAACTAAPKGSALPIWSTWPPAATTLATAPRPWSRVPVPSRRRTRGRAPGGRADRERHQPSDERGDLVGRGAGRPRGRCPGSTRPSRAAGAMSTRSEASSRTKRPRPELDSPGTTFGIVGGADLAQPRIPERLVAHEPVQVVLTRAEGLEVGRDVGRGEGDPAPGEQHGLAPSGPIDLDIVGVLHLEGAERVRPGRPNPAGRPPPPRPCRRRAPLRPPSGGPRGRPGRGRVEGDVADARAARAPWSSG